MSYYKEIQDFFDQDSKLRDREFKSNPILAYEQEARQKAIHSLIEGANYPLTLDAGCGNGRDFGIYLAHADRVIGVDFSEGMIKGAKARIDKLNETRVEVLIGDVTRLPFKDNTFDLIVCSEVLEHVPNWEKAIAEFHRLLKPEGELIISTPNKLSMWGMTRYLGRFLFGSRHPYDKWKTYFELRRALLGAGFNVIAMRGACYLPGDLSYYWPFKPIVSHLLKFFDVFEKLLSCLKPFNLVGYMIVIKSKR